MPNVKSVFVTGATGNQGSAVAMMLAQQGFKVVALTRNLKAVKTQKLDHPNIKVVQGNLNSPKTYAPHLLQCDGVFSVQAQQAVEKEVRQGVKLIEEAKRASIKHFVYSSVFGTELNSGIAHFDSKLSIENQLRESGISFTILRPVSFFENFLIPQVKKGIMKGVLTQPVNEETIMQFVSCQDIGKAVVRIFHDPESFNGKIIHLSSQELNGKQLTTVFSTAFDKPFKYQKLPNLIARLFLGKSVFRMFRWMEKENRFSPEYISETKKYFGDPLSLDTWLKKEFAS